MEIKFDLNDSEVQQLREVIDNLPLRTYAPLIVKVLKALPMHVAEVSLIAHTQKGKAALNSLCERLPHGDCL